MSRSHGFDELMKRLGQIQRRWILGRLFASCMWILGISLVFLAAYVVFDYFAALEPVARVGVNLAWAGVAGLAFVVALISALQFRKYDAARHADRCLGDSRRAVLSAFELVGSLESKGSGDLAEYLATRSVREGEQSLNGIRFIDQFPVKPIVRSLKWLACFAALATLVISVQGRAGLIGMARVFLPHQDIPPYSELVFEVKPATPTVVYGGKAEIAVEITGAPIKSQVWMRTRIGGRSHNVSCFKESPVRYAQRLENVVEELEFCFVAGKARSKWHKIALLRQPRIVLAHAKIKAPAYAGGATRGFYVGNEEFSGLRHSKGELLITSNRPLSRGTLTIVPKDQTKEPEPVTGELVGGRSMRFQWEIVDAAELRVVVRDVQGTANQRPLLVKQKVILDLPPEIGIATPDSFVMATPDAVIQLEAEVSDDYGVSRVEWIRSLAGYRERFEDLTNAENRGRSQIEVNKKIDLAFSGFSPGQLFEMHLEATDNNPELLGFATSQSVRIQIISKEDYAELIRTRMAIEDFAARFQVVYNKVDEIRKELEELKKAAQSGAKAPKEVDEMRKELAKKLMDAARLLNDIASDFPAYDLEKELSKTAGEIADTFRKGSRKLDEAAGDELPKVIDEILGDIGRHEPEINRQREVAEELSQLGMIVEMAMQFKRFIHRQSELKRLLERYTNPTATHDKRLLLRLGQRQQEVREELKDWAKQLVIAAGMLPHQFENVTKSCQDFYNDLEGCGAYEAMDKGVSDAANGDGKSTFRQASIALEKLKELLKRHQQKPFGQMCNGGMGEGDGEGQGEGKGKGQGKGRGRGGMNSTLKQMLEALRQRYGMGQGNGMGQGGGPSGPAGSGYSMRGHSALNVPVLGPKRSSFGKKGRGAGRGQGKGGAAARIRDDARETLKVDRKTITEGKSAQVENVPEKYREAVKRYFSEETR